jgi:ATP-dependent Clp protease protease subunit
MSETPEEEQIEAARQFSLVDATLLKNRTVTLFGEVTQELSRRICERLLALSFEKDDPITMFICSPGGHVESGDAIFDVMQFIKPVIRTVGTGWVGSIATHIYLAPEKEHRYSLPNTRYLIHQPAGGFGGAASDIEIHAREIIKTRERINRIIAERTGQPLERIEQDTDRDFWMDAEESLDYGIVGKIIGSVSEIA